MRFNLIERAYIPVAALLISVFVGAQGSLLGSLVGRWEATDRPWHIEFQANGSIAMSTIGAPKTGTYRLDTNNVLWVELQSGQRFTAKVSMAGRDQMTLSDPDGSFTRLRKVP
jgi:hypothetical protein